MKHPACSRSTVTTQIVGPCDRYLRYSRNSNQLVEIVTNGFPGAFHAADSATFALLNNKVIRVYDDAGNVIDTHEHKGDFKEP
jgi:hypothetical protein